MKKKIMTCLMQALTLPMMADVVPEQSDSTRVRDLDEVVVISQPKESFRLRMQPLSATMLSSEEMQLLTLRDLRDVSQFVPSFTMPNYGSRYTSSMYVRGIGSRVNSPAVGIYQDGMPLISKSAFNTHTYQLDRVDVLRGPQGTLYGQNSEGGLIRIYSKNPMNEQGTDVQLGLGTALYRNVEVAHRQKVSDQFAFSLAGFYNGQNGFFKNQHTGEKADLVNEAGAKARLIWQPTDRLSIDYLADYQFVRQNGFPYGMMHFKAADGLQDEVTGAPLEYVSTDDPSTNHQGSYRRNLLNTALGINLRTRHFDLHSTTSYQFLKDYMLMDIDYLPQDYMHLEQRQLQNALTQEFVLKSNRPSRWHWTVGAFASHQWLKTDAPVYFDPEMNAFLSKTITDYAYYGMLNSMAKRMGMEAAAAMIARAGGCKIDMQVATIPGVFRTPQTNLALFHQSDIDLSDRLTATLGLRYDFSHVAIDYETSALATLSEDVMGIHVDAVVRSALAHRESSDFSQLLPKFGLTYKLNNGSNLYATVTKGYRAGGFNIQMFSDILQAELSSSAQTARGDVTIEHDEQAYDNIRNTIAFKPETSWNYEFGAHLNLFSQHVQLDLAGFYMQVSNQQLSVMAGNYGFGRMMVNAGKSYSCGVEATLRGVALDGHLHWGASYAYTRAVFKDYIDSVAVSGKNEAIDYKDKRVPFVPEHTFSAHADYRLDFSTSALRSITFGLNVSGQGKTYWDEANTVSQKFYALLGAHVDFALGQPTGNGRNPVVLSLWMRNLTDTKYNTFAVNSSATGQNLWFAQRGNPMQAGIDLRLHF